MSATTPASLSLTTVPQSQADQTWITLTAHVTAPIAPVNGYSLYIYDAAGQAVAQQFGGVAAYNGIMQLEFRLAGDMAPGQYTVGFSVSDASSLSSSYGTPGNPPVPGGPLTITVTAD